MHFKRMGRVLQTNNTTIFVREFHSSKKRLYPLVFETAVPAGIVYRMLPIITSGLTAIVYGYYFSSLNVGNSPLNIDEVLKKMELVLDMALETRINVPAAMMVQSPANLLLYYQDMMSCAASMHTVFEKLCEILPDLEYTLRDDPETWNQFVDMCALWRSRGTFIHEVAKSLEDTLDLPYEQTEHIQLPLYGEHELKIDLRSGRGSFTFE